MSKKYNKAKEMPVQKVTKVELDDSDKNIKRKLILVALLLVFGVTMIVLSVSRIMRKDAEWTTIKANVSKNQGSCGEEFVLQYELGRDGQNATTENKKLNILYSDLCRKAYGLFSATVSDSMEHNLYYINHNVNTEIEIEPALYEALKLMEEKGNRQLYMGAFFASYDDIFFAEDDATASQYDTNQDVQLAEFRQELADFAKSEADIKLEFLADHRVVLKVSEAYQEYAKENEVTNYIDFFFLKNAFVCDYLADNLVENGYTHGYLSSFDGYTRNLDEQTGDTTTKYAQNIMGYEREQKQVMVAATMEYTGKKSIVCFKNFPITDMDQQYFYQYEDGRIKTPYVIAGATEDHCGVDYMMCYSDAASCSEIALEMLPVYTGEEIRALKGQNIDTIFCDKNVVKYTQGEELTNVHKNYEIIPMELDK